jgi:hypothetical protein
MDRRRLLMVVVGICVVNGMFSPYLVIALQIAPILMPEIFPRTVGWALFFSSIITSTATLLLSGLPAALYDRLFPAGTGGTASMWIWISGATLLSLPALENIGRTL